MHEVDGCLTRLQAKIDALRLESEIANTKHDEAQGRVKQLEQESIQKEQEITSLTHKNQLLEADVEKLEAQVKELKSAADDESGTRVCPFLHTPVV